MNLRSELGDEAFEHFTKALDLLAAGQLDRINQVVRRYGLTFGPRRSNERSAGAFEL